MDTNPKLRIIRRPEVEARTGLSRSSIYSKMTKTRVRPQDYDPTFPRPIPIGVRAVGWIEAEIDQWIEAQAARRKAS